MTPEVATEVSLHRDRGEAFLHTDYGHTLCECGVITDAPARPRGMSGLQDGGVCFACGGMTVRTGTCTTCTECGETGGCG